MLRFSLVVLACLVAAPASAQTYVPRDERGSLDARAQTDLDGNRALATVFNFGQDGRTGGTPGEISHEWPAGTGRRYIALTGLLVGAEVQSVTGATTAIVDLPNYRADFYDPDQAWTWAPVPSYSAGVAIARSDRPETWPAVWPDKLGDASDPGWPGAWNGILGKDAFLDGAETYTHYSDDGYDRNRQSPSTTYYPDSTDLDRAGLGIVVSERRLASRDVSVEDALFAVRDLYNAGTEDLTAVAATVWVADLVGGDADAADDQPVLFADRDLIVFGDADGQSSDPAFPGGQTVGAAALVLLETPEGLGFTTVRHVPAGGINFQSVPDASLYQQFMVPAGADPAPPLGTDYDTYASVGLFGIEAGASVRLATALVFGDVDYGAAEPEVRYAELLSKAEAARAFYAGGFVTAEQASAPGESLALRVAPNPFSAEARLSFSLGAPQPVRVEVFDVLGRRLAVLADGPHAGGSHDLVWDGRAHGALVGSGVYLVRLTTPAGVVTRSVRLVR